MIKGEKMSEGQKKKIGRANKGKKRTDVMNNKRSEIQKDLWDNFIKKSSYKISCKIWI